MISSFPLFRPIFQSMALNEQAFRTAGFGFSPDTDVTESPVATSQTYFIILCVTYSAGSGEPGTLDAFRSNSKYGMFVS